MRACLTQLDFERSASGELDAASLSAFHAHVDSCPSCSAAYGAYRRTHTAGSRGKNEVETAGNVARQSDDTAVVADASREALRDAETVALSRPPKKQAHTALARKAAEHFPKIEGYDIVDVLGHGGMGIVYRAVQIKLNRMVALKVLPAVMSAASSAAVLRFRSEATAAARLHHTNIVPVYDFGESGDDYYYAMELITGKPMDEIIEEFAEKDVAGASLRDLGTMVRDVLAEHVEAAAQTHDDPSLVEKVTPTVAVPAIGRGRPYYLQVARWMADTADALHYAHSQGIIHRDIKPANLILSVDQRIMIADFGLAKQANEQSLTVAGALLGTLEYMSPEQAGAAGVEIDHRTDIYSLGATMYELLCFQRTVKGRDQKQIISSLISRDPTPPRKIVPTVPHELNTICLRALEKKRDSRYATAKEFSDDLRRFVNDLPIVAKPPGPITRAIKFARRRKAPVIAVAAAVLLIALGAYSFQQKAWLKNSKIAERAATVESLLVRGKMRYEVAKKQTGIEVWNDAEYQFHKALEIDPDHVKTLHALALLKKEYYNSLPAGDMRLLQEADTLCEKALAVSPGFPKVLNLHGVILKMLGRYEEAIEKYREILTLTTEEEKSETHYYAAVSNLGTIYALAKDLPNAEDHLREGAKIAGVGKGIHRTACWRNLAALELHLRQPRALQNIKNALETNTFDIASSVLMARALLELGGADHVEEALDAAKRADGNANYKRGDAKRIRALAHLRFNQFEHAVKQAKLAILMGDLETINHLIIAIAEARQDHPTIARDSLNAADAAWPDDLRESKAYRATAKRGELWFDTYNELEALRREAEAAISKMTPSD